MTNDTWELCSIYVRLAEQPTNTDKIHALKEEKGRNPFPTDNQPIGIEKNTTACPSVPAC